MQYLQTNITNKKKVVILILAGIIFFFAGTLFLSSLKREEKIAIPVPTPFPTTLPTPTSVINAPTPPKQQIYKDILLPQLPFGTEVFEIEYLQSSETFVITVRESPYDENKKKAEDWLKEKGVEDLNDLKILYTKYRWVY